MGRVYIDYKKCINCGICVRSCPDDVYRELGRRVYVAYELDCMSCYLCELDCPVDCIYVTPERLRPIPQPY